ncbi:Crp/Fnr family transcriptional regulator [Salegentibacter sp.]|uniref:Crp/Fnr family transcriptional regulator n=1 Tax=Salegentibacter sp. TaxID=1903072 RepID=UPI0035658F80
MVGEKYLDLLRENILFKDLEEDKLPAFLTEFQEEVWPKNTCNISKTPTLFRFYIIAGGRVKIYRVDPQGGREFTMFLLTKNDVFDILCLLENCEHRVFYESLDEVVLLSVPIEIMRNWIREYPQINKSLLPYMGKQIRALEEYTSNVILADISSRLAKLILTHINHKSNKLELINDLTNDELANLIGSTRAVVNRHLQQFKKDGILKISRKKVEIQNLELLLKQAEKNHSQD